MIDSHTLFYLSKGLPVVLALRVVNTAKRQKCPMQFLAKDGSSEKVLRNDMKILLLASVLGKRVHDRSFKVSVTLLSNEYGQVICRNKLHLFLQRRRDVADFGVSNRAIKGLSTKDVRPIEIDIVVEQFLFRCTRLAK